MNKISHQTRQGITVEFDICQKNGAWNNVGGIYAFGYFPGGGHPFYVLYVGQAASFRDRLPFHERWDEAQRHGANTVLAAVYQKAGDRDKIEQILINELKPLLNTQHKF